MIEETKDLCHYCEHYWLDFPLPLDRYIPHCEILDKKQTANRNMDEVVAYPCLKCPFNSFLKKKNL